MKKDQDALKKATNALIGVAVGVVVGAVVLKVLLVL